MVKFGSDEEAVAIANDCPFGLGSSVFSANRARARAIGAQLEVRRRRGAGQTGSFVLLWHGAALARTQAVLCRGPRGRGRG